MSERWHEYDALTVRESSAGKSTDCPVEKIAVLMELHDVIARRCGREPTMSSR